MLLLFLPFLSLAANAADGQLRIQCASREAISQQIQFCSQNSIAVEEAENCYSALQQAWHAAGPDLAKVLSAKKARAGTKQKNELWFSMTDLEKAQERLNNLIEITESNMLVLASYPGVMLDSKDMTDGHVPCYAENYVKVERIVRDLDNKVTELLTAEEKTEELRQVANLSDDNIENDIQALDGQRVLNQPAPQAMNAQGLVKHKSDITADTRLSSKGQRSSTGSQNQTPPQITTKSSASVSATRVPASQKVPDVPGVDDSWVNTVIDSYKIENGN